MPRVKGRKNTELKKRLTIAFPAVIYEELNELANRKNITLSRLIYLAIIKTYRKELDLEKLLEQLT